MKRRSFLTSLAAAGAAALVPALPASAVADSSPSAVIIQRKLEAAPGIKITSKAFGVGRRYPIAARY